MFLIFFDLFLYKKETIASSVSILALYWYLIALKQFFCLKIFAEVWRHFKAMRIIALLGIRFCFLKKIWNFIHYSNNKSKKVIHILKLSNSISRDKTKLFQEHFVFLISDDIKKDHLRRCPLSEREKQDPLWTKLAVK